MTRILVEKDSYFDSVFLMLVNGEVKKAPGVSDAVVAMGTEMNLSLLEDMGLADDQVRASTPNDLLVVVVAENESAADEAVAAAKRLLTEKKSKGKSEARRPRSLAAALGEAPESNLAVISLPGEYAAREARSALKRGLNVMLFSDNVDLEEEIALKDLAVEEGLLMMGPDCGTAIINGVPLCFANVVAEGDIGVVAASGTGLQEVTCCIDRFGGGITQAIGTGGRDLKDARVGGKTTLMGIEALRKDPATKVIVVVSKPPAPEVAEKVLKALEAAGKPVVVHLIGRDAEASRGNLHFAGNLEETARMAVDLSKGTDKVEEEGDIDLEGIDVLAAREAERLAPEQRYLRGLYTGGTVADEALVAAVAALGTVYSNNQKDPALKPQDPHRSTGHTIVDLGDDIYTVGRPHPMIDPSTRTDRLKTEMEDPSMAVLLMDVVLGYGSHPDPAGAMLDEIRKAKAAAVKRGGYLPVIVSVIGTTRDYQGMAGQIAALEDVGCLVMPSNYQATQLAVEIVKRGGKTK